MKQITEPIDIFTATAEEHGKVYDRLISMGFTHSSDDYQTREAIMQDGDYYHTFMVRKEHGATRQFFRTGSEVSDAITAAQFLAEYGPAEVAAPETPMNPPNFYIDTHDIPTLRKIAQELAFEVGVAWHSSDKKIASYNFRFLLVVRQADDDENRLWEKNRLYHGQPHEDIPVYSAATQMGEIVRLLSTPVVPPAPPPPIAPEIHGYKAVYTAGRASIQFGCADIWLHMLRSANGLMRPDWSGNRQVDSITLSSGKTLSREQVTKILGYVAAVEEYAKKYPQKS